MKMVVCGGKSGWKLPQTMAGEHLKRASAEEIGQVAGIKVPRFSRDDRFFANPRKKKTTSARCSTAKAGERKRIGKQEWEGIREEEKDWTDSRGEVIENQPFILSVLWKVRYTIVCFFPRSFLNIPWYFGEFLVKERWSAEDNRGFWELIASFNFPLSIDAEKTVGSSLIEI